MTTHKTLSSAIRVAIDFTMGVALFALVAGFVTIGHGTAVAGPDHGSAYALYWSAQSGIGWHPLTRDTAILLLAITFGAVTALNLAIARHLHAASGNSADQAAAASTDLPDAHVDY